MIRPNREKSFVEALGRLVAAFLLLLPLGGSALLASAGILREGEVASIRLVEEEFKRCESESSSTQRAERVVHQIADRCGATLNPWIQPAAKVEHARIDQRNGAGILLLC